MKNTDLALYNEINKLNFTFFVGEIDEQKNIKVLDESNSSIEGFDENRISSLEKAFSLLKKNIYRIEQKFNYSFKEVIIILDNLNISFLNLTGSKKLNGSQIVRENITYILNTMKTCVEESEIKKTVLHIFNSKFCLDGKKIENLPVGLFGDFYSHELSLVLINSNDFKNLKNIFEICNIRIKKVLIKSFVDGANIINNNKDTDTFYYIKIKDEVSRIFYFENNSLKSEQDFNFGIDIIIKDISKITSLNTDTVKIILNEADIKENISDDCYINKKYFKQENFRKIKNKLIYEIIEARVREIYDIMVNKNINYLYYNKFVKKLFLEANNNLPISLKEIYKKIFSKNGNFEVIFLDCSDKENFINSANQLVHFGWKKEAIPTSSLPKSLITRFFKAIFE